MPTECLKKKDEKYKTLKQFFGTRESLENFESKTVKEPCQKNESTKWKSFLNHSNSRNKVVSGKEWQNPYPIIFSNTKKEEKSEADLQNNGFDNTKADQIYYPSDELIRKFEINLIRCCAAMNCGISIPSKSPTTHSKITAILSFNFLKWFPKCRVIILLSSTLAVEQSMLELKKIGIHEKNISNIPNFTVFKNSKKDCGQIMLFSSPQCLTKVIETNEAEMFINDIRLLVLDIKFNECCTKFKPILSVLTVKDVFFRCVAMTTSYDINFRRTSVITKRQQTITNLQLSDWIEQSETDLFFKNSNIPPGSEIKFWKDEELDVDHFNAIKNYIELSKEKIKQLHEKFIIPSDNLESLLWVDWQEMKSVSDEQIRFLIEKSEFLCNLFKKLKIDGVIAAKNYIKNKLRDENNVHLQNLVKEIPGFADLLIKIEKLNVSHSKYSYLTETIDKFVELGNINGVIFVKDYLIAKHLQEFLKQKYDKKVQIKRVINGFDEKNDTWPVERISTVFQKEIGAYQQHIKPLIVITSLDLKQNLLLIDNFQTSAITFIVCIDRESVFNLREYRGPYLLILHEKLERLRKDDGKIIVDAVRNDNKNNKKKSNSRNNYNFKFEPSRFRLNSEKMKLQFFVPKEFELIDFETVNSTKVSKVELSSKDHTELVNRIDELDFTIFFKKCRKFNVLSNRLKLENCLHHETDKNQLIWNKDLQSLGEVSSSRLSTRFVNYLSEKPINKIKRKFQYSNNISNKYHIKKLSECLELLIRLEQNY